MLSRIGMPELLLILALVLVVFGPSKLPELGKSIGKTIKEFRRSSNEILDDADIAAVATEEKQAVKSAKS